MVIDYKPAARGLDGFKLSREIISDDKGKICIEENDFSMKATHIVNNTTVLKSIVRMVRMLVVDNLRNVRHV